MLPGPGFGKFGKVELTAAYPSVTVPIVIPFSLMKHVDVALWWPEQTPPPAMPANAYHNASTSLPPHRGALVTGMW